MWLRRRLATENVGRAMCRPYAPTGAVSCDDDVDDNVEASGLTIFKRSFRGSLSLSILTQHGFMTP